MEGGVHEELDEWKEVFKMLDEWKEVLKKCWRSGRRC